MTQTAITTPPTVLDYLELISSVGGMAVALYVLVYLLVRTWTKNSLKSRLLKDLYKIAPNKSTADDNFDVESNKGQQYSRKALVFGPISDFVFNLCGFRSNYRRFAVKTLESELDIINIINENRNLRNAIRVILTENQL